MAGKTVDKKVLLMILDGWGKGDHSKGDVVWSAHPEYLNALEANYPHAQPVRTVRMSVFRPDRWEIRKSDT